MLSQADGVPQGALKQPLFLVDVDDQSRQVLVQLAEPRVPLRRHLELQLGRDPAGTLLEVQAPAAPREDRASHHRTWPGSSLVLEAPWRGGFDADRG